MIENFDMNMMMIKHIELYINQAFI